MPTSLYTFRSYGAPTEERRSYKHRAPPEQLKQA